MSQANQGQTTPFENTVAKSNQGLSSRAKSSACQRILREGLSFSSTFDENTERLRRQGFPRSQKVRKGPARNGTLRA